MLDNLAAARRQGASAQASRCLIQARCTTRSASFPAASPALLRARLKAAFSLSSRRESSPSEQMRRSTSVSARLQSNPAARRGVGAIEAAIQMATADSRKMA